MMHKLRVISVILPGSILLILAYCNTPKQNITPLTAKWEKAIPHQEIPEGIGSLKAENCAECHLEHYNEWRLSTHSHAWTDLQFQAELKKESSPYLCINCHIPLQNQQEYIVEGLLDGDIYKPVKKKNKHFDRDLQKEGITCAGCHVRNGAIIGKTVSHLAPHKSVADSSFLSEQLCLGCHNATAVLTPTLACSFETGDEWKAGPYFRKKNCISCHMPSTTRQIAKGYENKKSRYHFFPGSGIPKFDSADTRGLNGLGIYPSEIRTEYSVSDSIVFKLTVINEHAGHKLPTGDPERFFNISFSLTNEIGDTVLTKKERIGEKWQWHPEVIKLADNNLLPGEERQFTFSYQIASPGQLTLHLGITKHRLNRKSADYNKLGSNYPLSIIVFDKEYIINVGQDQVPANTE